MSGIIGVSGTRSGVIGETAISTSDWIAFTPACTGITSLSSERGWYKRIGYWVDVFVDLYGTGSEVYRTVTNLPYTVSSDTGYYAIANIMYVVNNNSVLSYGGGSGDVRGYATNGGTIAIFALGNNNNGWTNSNASGITASFSYQVESI